MTWQLVYSVVKPYPHEPIRVGHIFQSERLIIRARCFNGQPSWFKAGSMVPIFNTPEVGEVEGLTRRIYLKTKLISFDALGLPFDLEFRAVGWLTDISLDIWENPDLARETTLQLTFEP